MKARISTVLIVFALLVAQSGVALAQGRGWSAVQAVSADERLVIKQKDGKTISGKMIEATDTNLSITRNSKVENISKDNIAQIEVSRGKAQKTKWAGIGAAIGTGGGAAIGGGKASTVYDDSGLYVLAGVVIGAGVGAGVGALFGATRRQRELIYTAP